MPNVIRKHAIVFLVSVLLLLFSFGCSSKTESPGPPSKQAPFRICMGGILAPLPFIAQEKGFFQAEGVSVEIALLGDGKAAMNSFLEGRCDADLSGEPPIVKQSFYRNDFVIIASLVSSDNAVKILARRDRGINTLKDLYGKRVAVSQGIISEFFLDQFLKKNHIPPEKLTIVDISHREMPEALKRGDIDAFAGSDVAYLKGRALIGELGVTFTEPGLTNHAACLVVKKDWLVANPGVAQGVVRALVKAERELAMNPEELASMLARRLNIQEAELKSIMAEQHNRVTLDQVLLLSLEDEARWMLEKGIVKGKPLPNFLQFIDPAILKGINPSAVKLR